MSGRETQVRASAGLRIRRRHYPTVGETRATVLFADLRGYTGVAERLGPSGVVPLLEEFFDLLGRATARHDGVVFHVAGDGMMAAFGLDRAETDGARAALAASRAMLDGFAALAVRWRRDLSIDTGLGLGLHLGDVAWGWLGPPGRKTRTLLGDTVNVASRLCARARAGEVLLSAAVAAALDADGLAVPQAQMPLLRLPSFALRGRSAPLDIWCVPAARRVMI